MQTPSISRLLTCRRAHGLAQAAEVVYFSRMLEPAAVHRAAPFLLSPGRSWLSRIRRFASPRPDSSVVERGPEKAGVGGSIPSLATIFHLLQNFRPRSSRALAQWLPAAPERPLRRRFNPVSGHPFDILRGNTKFFSAATPRRSNRRRDPPQHGSLFCYERIEKPAGTYCIAGPPSLHGSLPSSSYPREQDETEVVLPGAPATVRPGAHGVRTGRPGHDYRCGPGRVRRRDRQCQRHADQ